ncbi:Rho termination factor N-terminal domain-containing protein [Idiomarina piscisalsi]|uniref:Addiction module toxin RelE n=1 Tax=Idiomarina piscisalsi TaxID=1096243 RepID=A0A432YTW5_9GAMM|nr:Rho termination factor N-terminal domain-containing protein [Idiomarina piscisalsi]RUO66763.1 addiction module toxin RelE [Idiomarina piscisalsi]
MPDVWRGKDERMYQHIKQSQLDDGKSEDEAKEIASRTVNKQRREEGVTDNTTTQGTGNPSTQLEERTKGELYNRAQQLNINNRSQMSKNELIEAIRQKQ